MTPRCPGCGDRVAHPGGWCLVCYPPGEAEDGGEAWSLEIEPDQAREDERDDLR